MVGVLSVSAVTTAVVAPAPVVRCTVEDPRLAELSGLVSTGDGGLWAMTDGGRRVEVHRLGPDCAITDTRTAAVDPFDAEDLALGPGGAFWVADTGDNDRSRDTVAVIELPARGQARLHRLTYPDGPHDAEALLVDGAGRPVVVTKEAGRPAGIYRTADAPAGVGPTPLLRVGELTLPTSDTVGGPIGGLGSRVVTGAAASADGRVLALRSYTDAWLYEASAGDPVAALTGAPVQVPLAGEPQGEAIAFEADGTLLSGSEARDGEPGRIRAVPGAAALVTSGSGRPAEPASATVAAPDQPPQWLPAAIGGGVSAGLLVVLAVALALRGRRRR